MSQPYDLFFSYRRTDLKRAQPLLDALDKAGLRVWRDTIDLPDNAPITPEIRRGLAASKALVAFYSSTYPLSRPCQQEITAAWITAQLMGEPPYDRVLVVNPETTFHHLPKPLAEQQSMGWPRDAAGFDALAEKIRLHVTGLETTLKGAATPVTPIYYGMTPVGAPRFVGRVRAMWDLHGQLTANRMSIITGVVGQATAQVRGLGGNGKSLLAREYAILFGVAYPGGIFWLNAYGNDDTKGRLDAQSREALRQDQIRGFAVRVGVRVEGLAPEQLESAFWNRIAENGQPCLWIVDDLPSELEKDEIERRWNAQWGGASTLITTRSTEYGALGNHLDLEVLTDTEAHQLLTSHRVPQGGTEEEAARSIAAELGNDPLAIEVAGSFLAKGTQSFRQYLDELARLDEDALEFGAELKAVLPTGHERSISGTLLKSIRLLGDEGMDFLCLASVLAVDAIPVRLVAAAFERVDSNAQIGRRVLRALDQADSLGLCAKEGDDARVVHTLVSRTIRYGAREEERTGLLRVAVARGLSSLLGVVVDIRRHAEVARELVHARHILSGGISSVEDADVAAWVGRHDYERGDYGGARQLQEQVLEARRRLQGEEHPDTLTAMNNLAGTRKAQGDLAGARQLEEQVLEASRRLLGEEHPDTLTAMNDLAAMRQAQGDLAGARQLFEQVLEASRRLLGEEHPNTLTAMSNLALTLQAQGDLAGARQLQEQVLEASRRLLGEEHPNTLTAMSNLALTLQAQGDPAGARQLQEQVLEARRRLQGEEHPDTLTAMNNLAGTRKAQGDLAGARQLEEQVLEASRRLLGEEHPDTLTAMNDLAAMRQAQGDLAGARQLFEQVLEASRRLLGEEHPDTLTAMNNLAQTRKAQGDLAGARQLQEQVLGANRRLLGEEHPNTLTAMNNLALTLQAQGDPAGARQLQEQVLEARRRLLGEEHPDTLTAMNDLAAMRQAQGDLAGARQLQEQVLEARRRLQGEEHPDTLTAMNNLAQTRKAQGDLAGARQLQEQVLEASRRLLGEEHPNTLTAMSNLALTLQAQGDPAGARQLQEQVLEASRRLLGEHHPDTTLSAWNLFQSLLETGDSGVAQAILAKYLVRLLGADPAGLAGTQQQIRQMLSEILDGENASG